MAVRQPAQVRADQESARQVTFTVEVDCAEPHPPNDLTYIDRARRAVLDADEDTVTVTPRD